MSTDLRSYISLLEQERQLTRIAAVVDPQQEIAAVTDRVCKQTGGGNALLFERPANSATAVATNLFGSVRRCELALGIEHLAQLTEKISELLAPLARLDQNHLDNQIASLPLFSRFAPVSAAPLWRRVSGVPDLHVFPFLQNWPDDGAECGHGCYITFGQVFTALPGGAMPNCGLYRAQVIAPDAVAIRWHAGSGAAKHLEHYTIRNEPMPVAIALGGAPALLFSAMMPLPGTLDETVFAGFLGGKPLELSSCCTVPLQVPAAAEVVIEGYVEPGALCREGPFGNHTGCYSPAGAASRMKITSVSMRDQAIIPATVVGPPPMEDCWMQGVWERVLLAVLQKNIPEIRGLHVPSVWSFHQSGIISLESSRSGMVREISSELWSLPWFKHSRFLLFVHGEINPADAESVAWHCINRVDGRYDIIIDSASGRVAIDATGCCSTGSGLRRTPDVELLVDRRWHEYGFI